MQMDGKRVLSYEAKSTKPNERTFTYEIHKNIVRLHEWQLRLQKWSRHGGGGRSQSQK